VTAATLYLFDDHRARRWAPLTLTRPVGELIFGCLTLRERSEHVLGLRCAGHLTRTALAGFDEADAAPVVGMDDVRPEGVRVLLSSRVVLEFREVLLGTAPVRIVVAGRTAGWVVPEGAPIPSERWLRDPDAAPAAGDSMELEGQFLERPWDLVAQNAERITRDVARLWPADSEAPSVFRVGEHAISLAEGAVIEPGVHVDLRDGPVRLAVGARVEGPARLAGPLFVGPGSTVLGGSVGTSSIGPVCLVHGEVAHSVLLGYVNKAHDGHLGHALLGRWVNLGAFTTNSDLKNNYRSVRVWTPDGEHDSGLLKVGCFLGDHVKTGIGTVLNTGTVIGAGSNVFGGLMPPTVVPPFSWGAGADLRDHRLDKFLETADRVMARRGEEMTPGVRELLGTAWKATAGRRAE
jgi:UDP-N-acetylglucosamine diphosphorylase / glucose-1-phosphate thymidylyltransferase / UDP-N-acetylgalactosamine diphosphorylase / glucosamine-1-phosphate N-acetyltransferase / galactosamine-1-phosphate N-acetyltransferase